MARLVTASAQLTFDDARKPVGRGGWRPGAGRKPGRTTPGHVARPSIASRNPVHVTLRCVSGLPSLRRESLVAKLRELIGRSHSDAFRVVELSVMTNHIHLMIECGGKQALSRAMHRFKTRAARLGHAHFARTGRVFSERYHARELRTPREVRNALRYVLNNARHHAAELGADVASDWLDPFSSASWFTGWSGMPSSNPARRVQSVHMRADLAAVDWLAAPWHDRGRRDAGDQTRPPARDPRDGDLERRSAGVNSARFPSWFDGQVGVVVIRDRGDRLSTAAYED